MIFTFSNLRNFKQFFIENDLCFDILSHTLTLDGLASFVLAIRTVGAKLGSNQIFEYLLHPPTPSSAPKTLQGSTRQ